MSVLQNQPANKMLPTREVCKRYGVCDRTIARWQANPGLKFPIPIIVNGRKYFDEVQMNVWDSSRAVQVR